MSLPSGSTLGPYEIGSLLGVGGMGEVYRASDTRIGRDVAIKILPRCRSLLIEDRGKFRLADCETAQAREWGAIPENRGAMALSADGRWLYAIRTEIESDVWMLVPEPSTP